MYSRIKFVFVLALCLLTFCVVHPCLAQEEPAILRAGVTANYPPIIFQEEGKYEGLEAEMARQLAKELNRTLEFVDIPFDQQIQALQDGKIDIIMAGMTITEKRRKRIEFSEPYFRLWQMALIRKDDAKKYGSAEMISNIQGVVGVEKGTTSEELVEEKFAGATIKSYVESGAAMKDLLSGQIETYIHDAPEIWWLLGEYENQGLTPAMGVFSEDYLGWGVRKDDKDLLNSINTVLAGWKESQQLDARIKFWLPYIEMYGGAKPVLY